MKTTTPIADRLAARFQLVRTALVTAIEADDQAGAMSAALSLKKLARIAKQRDILDAVTAAPK